MTGVNIGLYLGRFEPFHIGHEMVVRNALENCDILIICVGSHSVKRSQKNPWIAIERIEMIKRCFTQDELLKIKFYPLIDYGDEEKWITDIILFLDNFLREDDTVSIFGCMKDESSWYLNIFPPSFKKMFFGEPFENLSSTNIRKKYFEEGVIDEKNLPIGVIEYLKNNPVNFDYLKLDIS